MMRVLLISPNREEMNMPTWPLGMACVGAAVRRAGHEATLLDLMRSQRPKEELEHTIKVCSPDAIGVSVRNIDDQSMVNRTFLLDQVKEVIGWCRELSDAPLILGGAGYSMFPRSSLQYLGAEMGIQGEGEVAFPVLLARLDRKEPPAGVPGVVVAHGYPESKPHVAGDLDGLPLPQPDLLPPPATGSQEFWFPVQTRRGCPMNCNYCSTATIEGIRFRKRTPSLVVRWLYRWVDAGVKRLYFVDNTFNRPESYAEDLCSELSRANLNLSWRSIVYPGKVSERLVKLMARSGCSEVSLGFESGCDRILRVMNKRFTPGDVRLTSDILASHGIRRMGFLLLGGPSETRDSVQESLEFADSLNLELLRVTVGIRVYPHTQLFRTSVDRGMIRPDADLLFPTHYLEPALDGWIQETVAQWMSTRPNWIT